MVGIAARYKTQATHCPKDRRKTIFMCHIPHPNMPDRIPIKITNTHPSETPLKAGKSSRPQ